MPGWYALTLTPDSDGSLMVTAPAFPEVSSFGETEAEALRHGLAAVEEAIAARIRDRQNLPLPRDTKRRGAAVELPLLIYLKTALYVVSRDKGISRAEIARRMKVHREQVDRLFRLDHNSRLDQIEAAFKAIGEPLEVRVPSLAA